MITSFARSFRNLVAGVFAAVVLLSQPLAVRAQDATADSAVVVQQANTALDAQANFGAAPTINTRLTLTSRHDRLVELFTNHPERARSLALSAKTRAFLLKAEPSYVSLIEQDVPLTGQLLSSDADDFVHHTSVKHYSLHTFKGDRGLSFATAPSQLERMTGHKVTVTGLSLPEVVAVETVQEAPHAAAAPEASAVVEAQQSNAVAAPAATQALSFTGPGVPTGSATQLGSTFGNQTVAVLILKFAGGTTPLIPSFATQAFWNQDWNGPATPNVSEYTNEVSYGQTTVSTDVYGPITVPGNYNCNTTDAMATAAVTAAIAGGLDVSKYNHYVFVYPVASCYFGGLGSTGPANATALIPHQYTYLWIPITPGTSDVDFIWYAGSQHEFGHNLGMSHSNSLDFGNLSLGPLDYTETKPGVVTPGGHAPDASTQSAVSVALNSAAAVPAPPSGSTSISAINTEYGDNFAGMGDPQGPYNANHRTSILGWIPASSNQDVTASGSFTLNPAEINNGLRSLHVLRDAASSSWVWVEFHQPIGIYTPRSEAHDPLDINPNTLYTGAQMHYQNGFNNDGHTLLLDMKPVSQPNNFYQNALAPGASWSDPYSLLTITTGTQSASALGVSVSYDTPCAAVALDTATIPTAGGTGTVTITAPATCIWSVSSNASWISFPGGTTGNGNGSVRFVSTANTTVAQRNSYITAQRQSLAIVQPGTGISLLPRKAVSVAAGAFVPLVFNVVDNHGFADLSELDLTIKGGTQPDCSITTSSSSNDSGPSTSDVFFTLSANGITSAYGDTGAPGIISNQYCSIDAGASSFSANGKTITLTLMVSFPASYTGVHSVTGVGYGSTSGISVPLSYVDVTAAAATPQSVAISPETASVPATSNTGDTVPFTITGLNTNFTPGSTVQVSGSGVSVNSLSFVDAHTLSGKFTVSPTAAIGARAVTVNSGAETVATVFTVAAATPSIALSPSSGTLGTKVSITITGTNTNFTEATAITVSGTRVAANKVTYVSPTSLTAIIDIKADADSGQRTLIVATGTEVAAAYFTVTPTPIPHVTISPATGNQGDFRFVTFTGTDTNFVDATKITIPGTDIKVTDISVAGPTSITAKFTMTSTATASARVVTITSGTEVVKGTFTVTAYTLTTTSVSTSTPSIKETGTATLITSVAPSSGTGTPTGYVSFIEDKGGAGLEQIVGTVLLSGGTATLTVSNLQVGVHTFSAQYLGDDAAFAQSKSTAKAMVTVTADPGKVVLAETATIQMLSNGAYEAIVTIANSGKGTAQKVKMTSATLGGTASSQTLPVAIPDIAPGGSISTLFDFPPSVGTPGSASVLKFGGTYTGGNFSGSSRVTLPVSPATN